MTPMRRFLVESTAESQYLAAHLHLLHHDLRILMPAADSSQQLQMVTTPTLEWLMDYASQCRSRVLIASPFVNDGIKPVVDVLREDVSRTMVTRLDMRNFALGASNLITLCTLAHDGFQVRAVGGLHAKVYIFDASVALVTSANATFSGLSRNRECGLMTTDARVVADLAESFTRGFGDDLSPTVLTSRDLEAMQPSVLALKASAGTAAVQTDIELADVVDAAFSVTDQQALLSGFRGWTRLTLEAVLNMTIDRFNLDELLDTATPAIRVQYPNNRHVREKLRQQLQRLRDFGLVEFLGEGFYRRTVAP